MTGPSNPAPRGAQPWQTRSGQGAPALTPFYALFFIWSGVTSLNDVLIPKLKALFALSYAEVMLIQSAFFVAYLAVSAPAALLVDRAGNLRAAVIGLVTMMTGCLLFAPASTFGVFGLFLLALFVLAAGITILQVAANPMVAMLGKPQTAASRLTFAQAFNALGTTVFPYVGSTLILGAAAPDWETLRSVALSADHRTETHVVQLAYLGLAAVLAGLAFWMWRQRDRLPEPPSQRSSLIGAFELLKRPRFAYGMVCIFLYVGGEVAIGSLIVNYLMRPDVFGMDAVTAGKHVPYYWGGALVGRFLGGFGLRLVSPGKLLAGVAVGSVGLVLIAANTVGPLSGCALLAIGLCNAIMFPSIFALACDGLEERTADGSGLLCMAIVGGAVIPPLTGAFADAVGLRPALGLPGLCYAVICSFGLYTAGALRGRR